MVYNKPSYSYSYSYSTRPLLRGRAMKENSSNSETNNNNHPQESFVLVNKANHNHHHHHNNNNNNNNNNNKPETGTGSAADNFRSEIMSHQFSPPEENVDVDVHVEKLSPDADDTNINANANTYVHTNLKDPTENSHAWVVVSLLSLVSLLVAILLLARWMTRKRRMERKKSREVYEYLWNFDMDDVVVRKAATGGWHCSYKNGLASGETTDAKTIASVSAKTTHTAGTEESGEVVEDDEPLVEANANRKQRQRPTKFRPTRVQTDIYLDSEENVFSPL